MIELQNICKSYKVARRSAGLGKAVKSLFRREYTRVDALSDVSFTVRDGEMVGYIGPNGAGKSSTIKIMSGVLTPDSGTCVINGRVPWKERTAHVQEIGVVFGQRSQLWWDVPVADSFELLRDIYRVDGAAYRKTLSRLTELLELGELKRQNKADFARYLQTERGITVNPDSLFYVQVKRLHEYKRQHLNALQILKHYLDIKANPDAEFKPRTYLFGAKAAPGYDLAKKIIRFINDLGAMIDADPDVRGRLKIVYLEEYNVSMSERLMRFSPSLKRRLSSRY